MFHFSLFSVCWLTCLTLCGCSSPADLSVATQAGAAPIKPVTVPVAENAPALETKPDDLKVAEEILGVAVAQARAFSPRVLGLQESISRTVQQQFANQVLADSNSVKFRSGEARWKPTGPFRAGLHPRDSSGNYAGDEYISGQRQKLTAHLAELSQRFETTLQEETWLRLSNQDQSLIAQHDLIPQTIRETALENSQAIMRHFQKPLEEPTAVPPLSEWVVTRIAGTACEIAFPSQPTITQTDRSTTYTLEHGGRSFTVEFSPNVDIPENLSPQDVPLTLAQNNVAELEQQGTCGAVKSSTLADLPAAELCVFYQVGDRVRRERASYCRYAMLGRDFIAVNINDARLDDPFTQQFFESFRRRGDAP